MRSTESAPAAHLSSSGRGSLVSVARSDSAPLRGATTQSRSNLERFSAAARPSYERHRPQTLWMLPDKTGKDAKLYRLTSAIFAGLAPPPVSSDEGDECDGYMMENVEVVEAGTIPENHNKSVDVSAEKDMRAPVEQMNVCMNKNVLQRSEREKKVPSYLGSYVVG
ncbi:hypothetical protein NDU88_004570 [Pleurodeles waltl]|uniref:Uncharacterized protein n=1 Tax=Pleurodeles waltl TaxID=8319 RepID=A0AAV7SJ82_PLEWA|nr:hypothetical protein NDU88_004570 [Pleurodeles waltl]